MVRNGCRVPETIWVVIWMSIALPAVAAGQRSPIAITSVTATTASGAAVVTITADGPLPPPTVGTVDGPPRIFLDFAGVRPKVPAVTRSADPRVTRVRVAVNSAQPLITRVVIDLAAHVPHRIEQSPGRMVVVVGDSAPSVPTTPPVSVASSPRTDAAAPGAPLPPVAPLPEPPRMSPAPPIPATATLDAPEKRSAPTPRPNTKDVRGTSRSTLPPPPPKDLDRYLGQVRGTLDRLRLQQPLLGLITSSPDLTLEQLQMAGSEFQRLAQEFSTVDPPTSLRAHHDLLVQSARLGVIAASMRMEALSSGDLATLRNASSAASGAVLLFNRACEDLGCQ